MMLATQLGTNAIFYDEQMQESWILWHAGFGRAIEEHRTYVVLAKVSGGEPVEAHVDPFSWSNRRTYTNAHIWLVKHFDEVKTGQVVDVEFILGEVDVPKISERMREVP